MHVLEPPHVVHAPEVVSYYAQPIEIEARSNCATTACEGTLHWRTTGHPWQSETRDRGVARLVAGLALVAVSVGIFRSHRDEAEVLRAPRLSGWPGEDGIEPE